MSLERQRRLDDLIPRKRPKIKKKPGPKVPRATAWQMPENQSEFLDFLLTMPEERQPGEKTEAQWANNHGVSPATVSNWKKADRFRLEWSKRAAQKNISVERLQNILDMLYRKAVVEGDSNAATRWLGWVEKYMPPVKVQQDEEVTNLSDEELEAELRELLDAEDDG